MQQKAQQSQKPEKKKLKPECIRMDLFGDLLKFTKKAPDIQAPFRKYDALALSLAEESREERLVLYHFFCGVALTAHARRIKDPVKRREVFELKNKLFINLANNFTLRKFLNFRLCMSKRFKVLQYCSECTAKNTEEKLDVRSWKFCVKCTVDRNYYNVLSMFHRFKEGGASLFLGNELMSRIKGLKDIRRVKFGALKEEVKFRKFTFSPRNLVAIDLGSLISVSRKLIEMDEKGVLGSVAAPATHANHAGGPFQGGAGTGTPSAGPIPASGHSSGRSGGPAFGPASRTGAGKPPFARPSSTHAVSGPRPRATPPPASEEETASGGSEVKKIIPPSRS